MCSSVMGCVHYPKVQADMQPEQGNQSWCEFKPHKRNLIGTRSRVIDDIASGMFTQNICVAYVYFDYKSSSLQTADNVVRSLLKQLLCRINLIPRDLEDLYDDCTR